MKRAVLLTALLLTAITVSAQTTTRYLLGAASCSPWNGTYTCNMVPITHADGSQPSPANYNPAFVKTSLIYNGNLSGMFFFGNDNLGNAAATSLIDTPDPSTPGVQQVAVTLVGADFSATLKFTYVRYPRHCSGGRGGGCVSPWSILAGYVDVTK